jgi:cytochrome c oxidase subunit 3
VPLLNTIILLSSGISVTWAHHALINGHHNTFVSSIAITIFLGVYFSSIQAIEYFESSFNISDGVYGSSFFVATGFHGLHVLIGTTFLAICLLRGRKGHFRVFHHFGFEAAA